MNIKMRTLTIIAVGMLLAANIAAEDDVAGVGAKSCGQVLKAKKESDMLALLSYSWAQGFMSALNLKHFGSEGVVNLSDRAAHEIWLENFCKENPLSKYLVAVGVLWNELREQQGLEPESLLPPQ